jgi:hypothetical protein
MWRAWRRIRLKIDAGEQSGFLICWSAETFQIKLLGSWKPHEEGKHESIRSCQWQREVASLRQPAAPPNLCPVAKQWEDDVDTRKRKRRWFCDTNNSAQLGHARICWARKWKYLRDWIESGPRVSLCIYWTVPSKKQRNDGERTKQIRKEAKAQPSLWNWGSNCATSCRIHIVIVAPGFRSKLLGFCDTPSFNNYLFIYLYATVWLERNRVRR